MTSTRPPAVAGSFYPGRAEELARELTVLLGEPPTQPATRAPKALIAPHAGYVYSGAIAATAYARIAPLAGTITRVVLLGPAHRMHVPGMAVPSVAAFRTPLGNVELDTEICARLARQPGIQVSDAAHAQEHCLEVHLPFLQRVLGQFKLVPLLIGGASTGEVSDILEQLWGGDETLIVISSDLSHFLSYDAATRCDRRTADSILAFDPHLDHDQACGATPINGLLSFAAGRHLDIELLDLRNSGDTAGDRSRVVGYAAFALYEPA